MNSQAVWMQGDGFKSLPIDCPSVSGIGEAISVDTSVTQWGNYEFPKSSCL